MYMDDAAKEKFSKKVLDKVKLKNSTFMECVLELSDEMGIDPSIFKH